MRKYCFFSAWQAEPCEWWVLEYSSWATTKTILTWIPLRSYHHYNQIWYLAGGWTLSTAKGRKKLRICNWIGPYPDKKWPQLLPVHVLWRRGDGKAVLSKFTFICQVKSNPCPIYRTRTKGGLGNPCKTKTGNTFSLLPPSLRSLKGWDDKECRPMPIVKSLEIRNIHFNW